MGGGESGPGTSIPAGMLLVKSGFYEGLEIPLQAARTVIGRGRAADIVLAEATISRRHVAIGWTSEGWYVEDLGSTNGSFVNGSRFERYRLKQADEIVMGRLVVEVTQAGA